MVVLTIPKKIYDWLVGAFFPKANTMSYGAVSVGIAVTEILALTASRTGLIIQNLSTADVYIGGDAATLANGIKLEPGDVYENQDWIGAVYGIATAAASDVRFEQFYTA